MRWGIAVIASVWMTIPSIAQEADVEFNKWSCFPFTREALYDFEVNKSRVRVNNLNIEDGVAFITKAPTISFSATVANRTDVNVAVTVELVGMSGGKPVFALSGDAGFGFVAAGKNDEVKGTIVATRDTLKKAGTICVRVGGFGQTE
ncbi:hypothetical protein [Ancylobacter pratisalsi]|uniref:DUF4424 domain-containing protein n=1 Tax=Ancylobacter pratisalsi TaxID=1745854 RepID=A0A6P1YMX6_9HYPH|nr:hypothetical protein [Ancylobacter pratisalsi]QIB34787.1 hypothetical protein G3A50_14520 [Ancylobacter pratisalsi]